MYSLLHYKQSYIPINERILKNKIEMLKLVFIKKMKNHHEDENSLHVIVVNK